MRPEEVEDVVAGLRERGLIATVHRPTINRTCVRVVLPDGSEALWDTDGAAGLEAQVMANGMLVGFVPMIPGSWQFDVAQTIDAIVRADYGRGTGRR
jgi:hypothetical protein